MQSVTYSQNKLYGQEGINRRLTRDATAWRWRVCWVRPDQAFGTVLVVQKYGVLFEQKKAPRNSVVALLVIG